MGKSSFVLYIVILNLIKKILEFGVGNQYYKVKNYWNRNRKTENECEICA